MNDNVKRIKNKIKYYGIILNDVISIKEINVFEENNNITLPQELISFYTEIGNGGCMIDSFYLKRFDELNFNIANLKEEFIFKEYWLWDEDNDDNLFNKVDKGNIELINIGDSQSWNIIINGSEKGQMWFFTDMGIQPCSPKRSFLSWFEYWIDGNYDYFEGFVF